MNTLDDPRRQISDAHMRMMQARQGEMMHSAALGVSSAAPMKALDIIASRLCDLQKVLGRSVGRLLDAESRLLGPGLQPAATPVEALNKASNTVTNNLHIKLDELSLQASELERLAERLGEI